MGSRIHVLELQGELFFGTADNLIGQVERLPADCRYLVLDFRRLHQIDASGAHALEVIGQRAERRGMTVCLGHLRMDEPRGRYLHALGLDRVVPRERWFADLDRALEWAEDGLLEGAAVARPQAGETPLSEMSLFHGLTAEELATVEPHLERIELGDGDTVCLEGDPGDRLYLIALGNVSIKVKLDSETRARRLATFSQGVMFGEMALLEGKPRSADAYAKGERVVLHALSVEAFERILAADPHLGLRLQRNMSRELAARLRATSTALRALE
jgi:SulP family sulfate permease